MPETSSDIAAIMDTAYKAASEKAKSDFDLQSQVVTRQGVEIDPHRAARIVRASRATGLTESMLGEGTVLDDVEKELRVGSYSVEKFMDTPAFRAWRYSSPNNAAMSADDIRQTSILEKTAREIKPLRVRSDGVFEIVEDDGSISWAGRDPYALKAMARDQRNATERMSEFHQDMVDTYGPLANFASGALRSVATTGRLLGIGAKDTHDVIDGISQAMAEYERGIGSEIARGAGGLFADIPLILSGGALLRATGALSTLAMSARATQGIARAFGTAGFGALSESAAGLVSKAARPLFMDLGSKAAVGAAVQPLAVREGLETLREDGNIANALASWGIETVVPAAFGKTGVERVLVGGRVPSGMVRAASILIKDAGLEASEEVTTELAHALHEKFSGMDPDALNPAKIVRRLFIAGVLGGGAGAAFNAPGAIADAMVAKGNQDKIAKIAEAHAHYESLQKASEAASKSKLVSRDAESAVKVLQQTNPDGRSYIDIETWKRIVSGTGADPRVVYDTAVGNSTDWAEAEKLGTKLSVPIANLPLIPEKIRDEVIKDFSSSPDSMTVRETVAELESAISEINARKDDVIAESLHEQKFRADDRQKIINDIDLQLQAVGYVPKTSNKIASSIAHIFENVARRAGRASTAELYKSFVGKGGLRVKTRVKPLNSERGDIEFDSEGIVINITQARNASTFIHETGHLYLELIGFVAESDNATEDSKRMFADALEFLGAKSLNEITKEHHEKFARAYEAYLYKGKLPKSSSAFSLFKSFGAFIRSVYNTISALNIQLNPQITSVFDRLIATDAEIAESTKVVEPVDYTAEMLVKAGYSQEQANAISAAHDKAKLVVGERLLGETVIGEIQQSIEASRGEEIRRQAEAFVDSQPVYQMIAELSRGETKLNEEQFNIIVSKLGRNKPGEESRIKRVFQHYIAEGGVDINLFTERFARGATAEEAIVGIADENPRDYSVQKEYEQRIDDAVAAETKNSISKLVSGLSVELRARAVAEEIAALAKQTGMNTPIFEQVLSAAKEQAGIRSVSASNPRKYASAARSARRRYDAALTAAVSSDGAGKLNRARMAQKALMTELANLAMYEASVSAQLEGAEIQKRMASYRTNKFKFKLSKYGGSEFTSINPDGSPGVVFTSESEAQKYSKDTGHDYVMTGSPAMALESLLKPYDFAKSAVSEASKKESVDRINAWIVRENATNNRHMPLIPVEKVTKSWREIPLNDLREVAEVADQIVHDAETWNDIVTEDAKEKMGEKIDSIVSSMLSLKPKELSPDKRDGFPKSIVASHLNAAAIVREFDGNKDGGVAWNVIIRPINEAYTAFVELMKKDSADLKQYTDTYKSKNSFGWSGKKNFDGIGQVTVEEAIVVYFHWGTISGRQRIMAGRNVTEAQIMTMFESLSSADIEFAQNVQKLFSRHWHAKQAAVRIVNGTSAPALPAAPFMIKGVEQPGGYAPMIYENSNIDLNVNVDEAGSLNALQRRVMGAVQGSGSLNARSEIPPGMTVSLDMSRYLVKPRQEAYYVSHAKALHDMIRIVSDRKFKQAVESRFGLPAYREIFDWASHVTADGVPGDQTAAGKSMNAMSQYLRRNVSMATMAFSATTGVMQLTGIAQSLGRLGVARVSSALAQLTQGKDRHSIIAWVEQDNRIKARWSEPSLNIDVAQISAGEGGVGSGVVRAATKGTEEFVSKFGFWHIGQIQRLADSVTYLAAFDKAKLEGKSDIDAREIAYQTTIDTQGSGLTKDLTGIQKLRGPAMLLTAAYSYGATVFRTNKEILNEWDPRSAASWASTFMRLILVDAIPAAMSVLIKAAMGTDDDDEGFLKKTARETASTMLGSMILVRELSGLAQGYDWNGPMGFKAIPSTYKFATQTMQGEIDRGLIKSSMDILNVVVPIPTSQLWRLLDGSASMFEDDTFDPRRPLFGRPRN
jgi:hypothetical protein